MIFNISHKPDKKIEELYERAMKECDVFYGIHWSQGRPLVLLVDSRKDINLIQGRETEDWVVGFTGGEGKCLFMLNPESYEKESSHKYSEEKFFGLLKHELSHLYSRILYPGYTPKWLVEGIAIYSSGQLEYKEKPREFNKFLEFFEKGGNGLYDESGFAVEILIKEYGKENFFNFYKALKDLKIKEDLGRIFREYYKNDLNYDFFNKNLKL